MAVDIISVSLATVLSLIFLKSIIGVGIGTIVSAVLVGKCIPLVKKFTHPITATSSTFNSGVLGLGTYIAQLSLLLPCQDVLKNKSDVKQTVGMVYVMMTATFCLSALAMLVFIPDVLGFPVPILLISEEVLPGSSSLIYLIVLTLSLVTTGVSWCYIAAMRFARFIPETVVKSEVLRNAIPATIIMIMALGASLVGLASIYKYFIPPSAFINLFVMLVPLFFVAMPKVLKIRKERATANSSSAEQGKFVKKIATQPMNFG